MIPPILIPSRAELREKLRTFNYNGHQDIELSGDHLDYIMSAVDTYVDQILLRIMGTKTEGLFDNGDLFIKRAPLEQEIINIVGYEKWKAMQELLGFERTKAGL